LRQVIPNQVPVITWGDDELTDLDGIALLLILFLRLVTLALFVHLHDLGLPHLAHHPDYLFLSAQVRPELFCPMYLFLLLIPLL